MSLESDLVGGEWRMGRGIGGSGDDWWRREKTGLEL